MLIRSLERALQLAFFAVLLFFMLAYAFALELERAARRNFASFRAAMQRRWRPALALMLALMMYALPVVLPVSQARAQTYSPYWNPKIQLFNGSVPANGAKLCTLVAGTTTPLATYSDNSGTPNSNPVTLDTNGMATVYLGSGNTYKFILYAAGSGNTCNSTSVGSLIWSQDNIAPGVTLTGNNNFSGSNNFAKINGECELDGSTNTTLAQAITCAGSAGVIHVTVSASSVTVPVNASIPAGVTLKVDQGAQLSISTGVTVTINGPVSAGNYQIFTYNGTGVVQFGYANAGGYISALWFPGADLHAWITNAYNAMATPPSTATILVPPNPAGGCYTTTTTGSLATIQKAPIILGMSPSVGNPDGGTCDNFTPTITGSAVSISAISVAATLVTVTCSATCTTGWTGGSGSGATVVTIRGVTVHEYDGSWMVQTVTDGTHFTYNANIGAPGASSGGNVAKAPIAFELDWTATGGGGYSPGAGFQNYELNNNACQTNFGCGSYAVGLFIGRVNGGIHKAYFLNDKFAGFGTAVEKSNGTNCIVGWGNHWLNTTWSWNNVAMNIACNGGNENEVIQPATFYVNGYNLQLHTFGAEVTLSGGSFGSQGTCGAQLAAGAILHTTDVHFENNPNTTTHYVCSTATATNSVFDQKGGYVYDDVAVGTTDNYFTAGIITASNVTISSNGRTLAGGQVYSFNTSGTLSGMVLANGNVTWTTLAFGPNACVSGTSNGGVNPVRYSQCPTMGLSEGDTSTSGLMPGTSGAAVFAADSTDHFVHYNPNNLGDQKWPQAVYIGSSAYTNATTTFSTVTGMSWSIKASRSYRLDCTFVGQGSATTAGPKFQLTGPAAPTIVKLMVDGGTGAAAYADAVSTGFSSANTVLGTLGAGTTDFIWHVNADVVNGSTAGTLVLQAAANGAGTLTISGGSCQLQ